MATILPSVEVKTKLLAVSLRSAPQYAHTRGSRRRRVAE